LTAALPLVSCALSGHHRLYGTVDTCRCPGLFCWPKRHCIAAQLCRVDRPLFSLTCTATYTTHP